MKNVELICIAPPNISESLKNSYLVLLREVVKDFQFISLPPLKESPKSFFSPINSWSRFLDSKISEPNGKFFLVLGIAALPFFYFFKNSNRSWEPKGVIFDCGPMIKLSSWITHQIYSELNFNLPKLVSYPLKALDFVTQSKIRSYIENEFCRLSKTCSVLVLMNWKDRLASNVENKKLIEMCEKKGVQSYNFPTLGHLEGPLKESPLYSKTLSSFF